MSCALGPARQAMLNIDKSKSALYGSPIFHGAHCFIQFGCRLGIKRQCFIRRINMTICIANEQLPILNAPAFQRACFIDTYTVCFKAAWL